MSDADRTVAGRDSDPSGAAEERVERSEGEVRIIGGLRFWPPSAGGNVVCGPEGCTLVWPAGAEGDGAGQSPAPPEAGSDSEL